MSAGSKETAVELLALKDAGSVGFCSEKGVSERRPVRKLSQITFMSSPPYPRCYWLAKLFSKRQRRPSHATAKTRQNRAHHFGPPASSSFPTRALLPTAGGTHSPAEHRLASKTSGNHPWCSFFSWRNIETGGNSHRKLSLRVEGGCKENHPKTRWKIKCHWRCDKTFTSQCDKTSGSGPYMVCLGLGAVDKPNCSALVRPTSLRYADNNPSHHHNIHMLHRRLYNVPPSGI